LSPALESFIGQLATEVRTNITEGPSGSRNISEWCKKKDCWASVQRIRIDIPASLKNELISEDAVKKRDKWFGETDKPVIPDIECLMEQEIENLPDETDNPEEIEPHEDIEKIKLIEDKFIQI
jgi:hypothetical protein